LGILSIGFVVVALWVPGFFSITGVHASPTIFDDILFHSFFAFIQDIVFIAILFRILEQNIGTWLSLIAASIIFGFHFTWNFIQYAIIGFPVMEHSQPLLAPQFSGPDIITGYPVGLEASV
jgi:membrane protease YdiL (CAAX protease family)